MVVQETRRLDLTLSHVVPSRAAACGDAGNAGVQVCPLSMLSHLCLLRVACRWGSPILTHQKRGRANML